MKKQGGCQVHSQRRLARAPFIRAAAVTVAVMLVVISVGGVGATARAAGARDHTVGLGSVGMKTGFPWLAAVEGEVSVAPRLSVVATGQTLILATAVGGGARYRFPVGGLNCFTTAYGGRGETIPFDVAEKFYWSSLGFGVEAFPGQLVRLAAEVGASALYFPDRRNERFRPYPYLSLSAGLRF